MLCNRKTPLLVFFMLSSPVLANDSYIPVLYNLSLLYGFVPIRGDVKELNVSIEDEKGRQIYELDATLSQSGCLDSLQFNDKRKRSELILRRDGRTLKGIKDWSIITISLDEKCNIVSKTENGGLEQYEIADNGLLMSTRFMGNKVSEYLYDERGNVNMTKFYSSRGVTASNVVMYSDPQHKPLDYTLINSSRYSENYATNSVCQYDERGTPGKCDLTITWEDKPGKKPLRLKVYTQATFY
ncbi:YnfC family lipoprotein [Pseudocitrobacter vendiensis]|uniref:YnfC family lipoprotein n=1 Tax=Pseudocitrobacter vendiensis TaxID=2488306 RepID=A0ABM9FH16_9ENTR|nr:YnfC family lipoprotein [Pseudocitrobacter vendiensis]CAH6662304.1 putative protein family (UPF0257) [Pseudocitrobacter vendiensis]